MKIKNIKNIVLAFAMLFSVASSFAEDQTKLKYCLYEAEVSQLAMQVRQTGISITEAIEILNSRHMQQEAIDKFVGYLVKAYKYPAYQTAKFKEKTISDFGASTFSSCVDK